MDLFVVPTIGFDLLCAFIIVRLGRRDLVWINVATNRTAEWVARQIAEAFPWDGAPGYMTRDRDRIYGTVVTRRLRAMGVRDKPIGPRYHLLRAHAAMQRRAADFRKVHRRKHHPSDENILRGTRSRLHIAEKEGELFAYIGIWH